MRYEALVEYMASQLLKKSNVADFVEYDLIKIKYDNKESFGCVSVDFKDDNEILIPL